MIDCNPMIIIIITELIGGEGGIRTLGLFLHFNRLVNHAVTMLLNFGRIEDHE